MRQASGSKMDGGGQLSLALQLAHPLPLPVTDQPPAICQPSFANPGLSDLRRHAEAAKPLFLEWQNHLRGHGFEGTAAFMAAPTGDVTLEVIRTWLGSAGFVRIVDGVGDPYEPKKARWLFLAWIMRDAPEQRLKPLLDLSRAATSLERRTEVLEGVRLGLGEMREDPDCWTWPALREVIAVRLEGSRRVKDAKKVERKVRAALDRLRLRHGFSLSISETETDVDGSMIDIIVSGLGGSVLMPVKSRTTGGGGHSRLYRRDVSGSVTGSTLESPDIQVLPVVIAEFFQADLAEIGGDEIRISLHPSDPAVSMELDKALEKRLDLFRSIAGLAAA